MDRYIIHTSSSAAGTEAGSPGAAGAERALLDLLDGIPLLGADAGARIERCWRAGADAGESLLDFLTRNGVLGSQARRTVAAVSKGYLALEDPSVLATRDAAERLGELERATAARAPVEAEPSPGTDEPDRAAPDGPAEDGAEPTPEGDTAPGPSPADTPLAAEQVDRVLAACVRVSVAMTGLGDDPVLRASSRTVLAPLLARRLDLDAPTVELVRCAGALLDVADSLEGSATRQGHSPARDRLAWIVAEAGAPKDVETLLASVSLGTPASDSTHARDIAALGLRAVDRYVEAVRSGLTPRLAATTLAGLPDDEVPTWAVTSLTKLLRAEEVLGGASAEAERTALIVTTGADPAGALAGKLEEHGVVSHLLGNGAQAWDALAELSPTIVLVDCESPQIGGRELLARVRAEKRYRHIPVVVLTSTDEPGPIMDALERGAADYIVLGGNLDLQVARLQRILEKAAVEQERRSHAISGDLAEMSLIDILQVLSSAGRSVRIDVRGAQARGEIHLDRGSLQHARTEDLEGEEAFYALVSQTAGGFSVKPGAANGDVTIHTSLDYLILEGMRRLDEEAVRSGIEPRPLTGQAQA